MLLAIICGMCKAANQTKDFTKTHILQSKLYHITANWWYTPVILQFLIWAQRNEENGLMPGRGQLSFRFVLC